MNFMKSGITARQYMFLGAMAAICFVLAWVLGTAVNAATGIPLTGGILNGLILGVVLTIALKVVDKFWAATILWLIFGILAIPSTTLGPPGIYKIPVALIVGFVWDISILFFKRMDKENLGYVIGGASMSITSMLGVLGFMILLGLPGVEKLQSLILYLLIFYAILGAISVYLGIILYQRKIQYLDSIQHFKS